MGILNQPTDGLYSVLVALYECSYQFPGLQESELLAMCSPGEIPEKQVRQTLNRWTKLGLFVVEDGVASVAPRHLPEEGQDVVDALREHAREITMDPRNNDKFWEPDSSGTSDFTRALAWLLAQDIYRIDTRNHDSVQALESIQSGTHDATILQNDVRWGGLTAWGVFLGFMWWAPMMVVDPTRAVRSVLPIVFGDLDELGADEFIERLAKRLPVLDRGEYRCKVEKSLNDEYWQPPPAGALSTSLSLAIRRLLASGDMRAVRRADAGSGVRLTGHDGVSDSAYTHFLRKESE